MILHPITVDDREPHADILAAALKNTFNVPAVVGRIDTGGGDYRWVCEPEGDGPWLAVSVERKTISDLLASTRDDRLSDFVHVEPSPLQLRILLVEGDILDERYVSGVDNLLLSIQCSGVMLVHAAPGRSLKRLASLWKWSGKEQHQTFAKPALPYASSTYFNPAEKDAVRFLMCIPGWGEEKSRAALEHFGTLEVVLTHILTVSPKHNRLLEVKGIGSGLVANAHQFLTKKYGSKR